MPICSAAQCERSVYCKGVCKKHHSYAFLGAHPGYANQARKKYREKYPEKIKGNHRRITGRFSSGKTQAKRRNLTWTLTLDEHARILADGSCFWCRRELNQTGSGLDRLDNRIGYELGNVVPSCWGCNVLKGRIEGLGFVFPRTGELMRELLEVFERKYSPLAVAA